MKRFTALMLLVVLVFSLFACGEEQKAEKYCWNCGEGVSATASFCEHCGTKLNEPQNNTTNSKPTDNNQQKYIGVWKCEGENEYIYVYENGDGDYYGKEGYTHTHYNHFNWETDGEYFVKRSVGAHGGEFVKKYKLEGECLLDGQGKVAFRKYRSDPTIDI